MESVDPVSLIEMKLGPILDYLKRHENKVFGVNFANELAEGEIFSSGSSRCLDLQLTAGVAVSRGLSYVPLRVFRRFGKGDVNYVV